MISEDKNNKVNFGKSVAAPLYNGTAGPGDEKWCTKIKSKPAWIRPKQIASGTLKMTTTGSLN